VRFLAAIARVICAVNLFIGNLFSWLALGIVLVCFTVVVQRYLFAISFVWMQDLYIWLNGAMFTAVAGFALLRDDHVRVDIFYRGASERQKALVDVIGAGIFLIPVCGLLWWWSWPYVAQSWAIFEGSKETSGIHAVFALKTVILLFAGLIGLQGVAMMARSLLTLIGRHPVHQREDGAQI